MKEIRIHHRGDEQPTLYKIWTVKEAQEQGIPYKDWREAEEGEYALSDDGYIAKVITKRQYDARRKGGKNSYYRFPWGYHFYNPKYDAANKKKLKMEGRKTPHTLSGKSVVDVKCQQEPLQSLARVRAQVWDDDIAIAFTMGDLPPSEYGKYKRLMRTEEFKKEVRKQLRSVLAEKGIDEDSVVDMLIDGIEMAKQSTNKYGNPDLSNYFKGVEHLSDMLGMRDKDVKKTTKSLHGEKQRRLVDEINQEETTEYLEGDVVEETTEIVDTEDNDGE